MPLLSTLTITIAMLALSSAASPGEATRRAPQPSDASAKAAFRAAQQDVDAFMEQALAKREIDWEATYDYVFNEVERLRIRGAEIAALQSFDQEYTWYVREGYLVRSPWSINGVEVDKETREEAELEWIADVKDEESDAPIQRDSFFDFEFEAGNYLFAGREVFEGREVVRIEYYPTDALFNDDDEDDRERRQRRDRDRDPDEDDGFDEEEFEHMFAKTSLVTMLVVPEEHQIVKWTFENVGFEFLPYRWLFRMDELRASMAMNQPIEGVWLPHDIQVSARASTASFDLEVAYSREFSDYKEPAVGAGVVFGRPKR
jgi:hypothetical protein